MAVKVAINGFGRIGRLVFRAITEQGMLGKDIEVVGLSIDESQADAEQFLARKSAWSLTLGLDSEQKLANQFKPPKMPTSYVIDRKGVVRQMNAGFERSDLEKIEAQLLKLAAAN